ncbi:MAG TPA: hypothetical protein VJR92_09290 [Gemmatimonadaceae bacterium]|nr:hypothetical protein [Gemmatimonadaceae bacterium]
MHSRSGYILVGACGGLFMATFTLMDPAFAKMALWVLGGGAVCGGIAGAVMHATQKWESHGPAGNLLRWISGLGLAGLVVALVASAVGAIPFAGVPGGVGLGLLAGMGCGLELQYRPPFLGGGYRERKDVEIEDLWVAILGTIVVALGLITASWKLAS